MFERGRGRELMFWHWLVCKQELSDGNICVQSVIKASLGVWFIAFLMARFARECLYNLLWKMLIKKIKGRCGVPNFKRGSGSVWLTEIIQRRVSEYPLLYISMAVLFLDHMALGLSLPPHHGFTWRNLVNRNWTKPCACLWMFTICAKLWPHLVCRGWCHSLMLGFSVATDDVCCFFLFCQQTTYWLWAFEFFWSKETKPRKNPTLLEEKTDMCW